ncbi:MAG: T9SS type A sorting domain-containing protein, partial [Bacteroidia bacterium]
NCNYTSTPLTGINNIATDADFAIYPNPTYNSAIIDLSAFKENPVNITLYDALGRQVKNIMNIKTDKYVLTRDDLISGIYFMNVTVEGRKYSKKIIFE